jgi:hypothetical protein
MLSHKFHVPSSIGASVVHTSEVLAVGVLILLMAENENKFGVASSGMMSILQVTKQG